ncbi:MAG TPA: hypothetical protein VK071_11890 [Tissierellales bacterium]|nr:hypothetical protein [Tissierellales bacterium]
MAKDYEKRIAEIAKLILFRQECILIELWARFPTFLFLDKIIINDGETLELTSFDISFYAISYDLYGINKTKWIIRLF